MASAICYSYLSKFSPMFYWSCHWGHEMNAWTSTVIMSARISEQTVEYQLKVSAKVQFWVKVTSGCSEWWYKRIWEPCSTKLYHQLDGTASEWTYMLYTCKKTTYNRVRLYVRPWLSWAITWVHKGSSSYSNTFHRRLVSTKIFSLLRFLMSTNSDTSL